MDFEKASEYIQEVLKSKLSPKLHYHSYKHTMLVYNAAIEIALAENITIDDDFTILKTAALYHDSGFVNTYEFNSEEESCLIARAALPGFDYSEEQINIICELIMKTKMPQSPETHLQKILCDADLDYLGHNDFEVIGNKLLSELNAMGKNISVVVWNAMQIEFLQAHHFWTEYSISKGEYKKVEHLQLLKKAINNAS